MRCYLFAASGHSANALGTLFGGVLFFMGSHFFGRKFIFSEGNFVFGKGNEKLFVPYLEKWRDKNSEKKGRGTLRRSSIFDDSGGKQAILSKKN